MPQQESRFIKIRKKYLTFFATHGMLVKEVDTVRKYKLRAKCSQIQFNCQLLLDLASDLTTDEKNMLIKIKDKELPTLKENS